MHCEDCEDTGKATLHTSRGGKAHSFKVLCACAEGKKIDDLQTEEADRLDYELEYAMEMAELEAEM
jgi:hypothetical protein